MLRHTRRRTIGFTLIEMAIVLGIIGILVAGLWRILSGANQQVRDESAATQQEQLIDAVKAYLAGPEGMPVFLTGMGPSATQALPLPATQAAAAGTAACSTTAPMSGAIPPGAPGLCAFLPPGFWSGTTNSYGQTFSVIVLKDGSAAGTAPSTYSFMIITSGGTPISDTSGARIASLISNGDGGFIYSTDVCNATNLSWACGAFGAWSVNITTTYGYAAPATGGYVASRSYVSLEQVSTYPWLARKVLDTGYKFNTMQTPEYMGGNALLMGSYSTALPPVGTLPVGNPTGAIYMGNYSGAPIAGSGGVINLQGGAIDFDNSGIAPYTPGTMNMQGGTVNFMNPAATTGGGVMNVQGGIVNLNDASTTTGGGAMNMDAGTINMKGGLIDSNGVTTSEINMVNPSSGPANTSTNALVNLSSGCLQTAPGSPAGCFPALNITGDVSVSNLLNANALYAGTFIYSTSDIRLKTNVHPIQNSLDDIMRLKPVSFNFKSNGQAGLGVIAQDLEKVYPQLVANGNYKSVNYDGLIGPLIGAVQELKRENDQLRQQVEEQAAREGKLEKELQERAPK